MGLEKRFDSRNLEILFRYHTNSHSSNDSTLVLLSSNKTMSPVLVLVTIITTKHFGNTFVLPRLLNGVCFLKCNLTLFFITQFFCNLYKCNSKFLIKCRMYYTTSSVNIFAYSFINDFFITQPLLSSFQPLPYNNHYSKLKPEHSVPFISLFLCKYRKELPSY